MQKPSIPKGTRDFSPVEMAKRNYIFNTIRDVYHLYGFQQIETPAMENLSTLMGKYGDEGDKLLFKILESGNYIELIQSDSRGLTGVEKQKILNIEDSILDEIFNYIKNEINNTLDVDIYLDSNIDVYYNKLNKEFEKKLSLKYPLYSNVFKYLFYKFDLKSFSKINSRIFKNNINTSIRLSRSGYLKSNKLTNFISEKGLRYDLTVPFARFVVQHRNELSFPFKRYQIQPVWRADRPQKGRYREFYQCDGDVVGSDSLLNEVELIQIMDEVYQRFGIRVSIKMNNRKILSGIAEIIGEADKIVDITVAIDKLDKIGLENVNAELRSKELSEEAIAKLQPIIQLSGSNREKIAVLKEVLAGSETGLKGVAELEFIFDRVDLLTVKAELELDLTLARGLNYYTGAIFEVKALDVQIGSITGGGRYDNLTGVFGMDGVSGVGISFGADRIFDVLNQLELYPEDSLLTTQLMFVNFGEKEEAYLLPLVASVRAAGIRTEIYPEPVKMKKQMGYADAKKIPFVALVGESEMTEGKINLKNMITGEQKPVTVQELIEAFK